MKKKMITTNKLNTNRENPNVEENFIKVRTKKKKSKPVFKFMKQNIVHECHKTKKPFFYS